MSTTAILCYPTHGHVTPKLAVAEELVRRGERIVYYSTEESQAKIEATGAEYRPYTYPYHAFDPTPPTEGLFNDMKRLLKLTQKMLPELLTDLWTLKPDYLLLDSKSVWGNLAAQILDLPAATLSVVFGLDPKLVTADYIVPRLYGGATVEVLQRALIHLHGYFEIAQELNDSYRIRSPNVVEFLGNPQPLNIIFTSRLFQCRLGGELYDDRYQFVGPSISERVEPDFPFDKLGTAPLVYISMGTVFNDLPDFYRACFTGLAELPCQVVMQIGCNLAQQALDDPPANFLLCEYAPQLKLLEQAALFITHGGMNSVNEGLFYGVPLFVVPQRGDQYIVAGQVAELGAGLRLFPHEVTPERLQGMVTHILNEPGFRQQAQRLGQSLRDAGGYQRAADEIFAFKERMGIH